MNMMKINSNYLAFFSLLSFLFFSACSAPIPEPVKIQIDKKQVSYLKEVKPILDKRCVTCHSCYNSPCQAKMSSYEGIERGASKDLVYDALRLWPQKPTRLFIDAHSTEEWKKKGFYSMTQKFDANENFNDSIMMHMLYDKKMNPDIIGAYKPEKDTLICPKTKQEMGKYLKSKPNHGMPYGFPAIEDSEYNTLTQWIAQGAKGPTKDEQRNLIMPSKMAQIEINKWEKFFNARNPKHTLTARYLYEHLFLAHIHFKEAPNEFYKLVRSYTPRQKPIEVIPTLRPYDDPEVDVFYYRFEKIHSTIVHKTHMVIEFDDEKLATINELFIKTKWKEKPYYIDYDSKMSANPFIAFDQIPSKSKYQFLLNNAHYIVMTFIRGPVCRGQMALNVIHDHFWIMFIDPDHDASVVHPNFLREQAENLSMPIETSSLNIFKIFSDAYRDKYIKYFDAKQEMFLKTHPEGVNIDYIWKGNKATDTPLLTIYRHFDSASVHKGVLGGLPRTIWAIDYSQLERIYYSLVAGYDVFGNVAHQTNVRRYMDFLRFEGELNFIAFMPKEKRADMLFSWYIGDNMLENVIEDKEHIHIFNTNSQIKYKTSYYKNEFLEQLVNEHILKSTNIHFDKINYRRDKDPLPKMPSKFDTNEDLIKAAQFLSIPGTSFIKHITDEDLNLIHIRIKLKGERDVVTSIIINRWHDNVNSLFDEESTLNPDKDDIDFIEGSIGSYPNAFAVVEYEDLPDFFDLIGNFKEDETYLKKIDKYFIDRTDKDFWKHYDWFQKHFNESDPIQAGLYDLNRYYPE